MLLLKFPTGEPEISCWSLASRPSVACPTFAGAAVAVDIGVGLQLRPQPIGVVAAIVAENRSTAAAAAVAASSSRVNLAEQVAERLLSAN